MAFTFLDEQLANIELSEQVRQRAIERAKEGYVIALLEVGEISSGRAAKILGISRLEMMDRMNKWGISVFDDSQDLQALRQEVEQAESILNQSI
ncbi:UPF0175 family protein [Roseofilum sp. BLCC_M154]|uniref:UPF0175 family protein n=1 Tax=Roseofilum acuticapitatum BLCC-M154 TaxID=3022444 RepID=A0ABT7AXU6_9CYAN|nr:UPF0175 family protein [Roseofilum acuticapitatum]MDJ1171729.1 UPF0175 family protein [Roseofilum acuticapitatum BLCC-M154]